MSKKKGLPLGEVVLFGMLGAAAFAKPLARKFGKAEISVVSNLVAAGVCVLLFFIIDLLNFDV